jgi:hypothetical protein
MMKLSTQPFCLVVTMEMHICTQEQKCMQRCKMAWNQIGLFFQNLFLTLYGVNVMILKIFSLNKLAILPQIEAVYADFFHNIGS